MPRPALRVPYKLGARKRFYSTGIGPMKSYLCVLLSAEVLAANGHDTIEHGKPAAYYLDMLPGGRRQSALAAKDELDIDVLDIGDRKVEDNADVGVGPSYSEPQSEK